MDPIINLNIKNDESPTKEDLLYLDARREADEYYKTINFVTCPAFEGERVYFTSEGFNHIIYRGNKIERERRAQLTRFKLINLAKKLLEKTTTVQECEEYSNIVKVFHNKRKEFTPLKTKDWGFVGVIGNTRIKVVVRRIGNGSRKFHSVIPYWNTKFYKDIKITTNTSKNNKVSEDD